MSNDARLPLWYTKNPPKTTSVTFLSPDWSSKLQSKSIRVVAGILHPGAGSQHCFCLSNAPPRLVEIRPRPLGNCLLQPRCSRGCRQSQDSTLRASPLIPHSTETVDLWPHQANLRSSSGFFEVNPTAQSPSDGETKHNIDGVLMTTGKKQVWGWNWVTKRSRDASSRDGRKPCYSRFPCPPQSLATLVQHGDG